MSIENQQHFDDSKNDMNDQDVMSETSDSSIPEDNPNIFYSDASIDSQIEKDRVIYFHIGTPKTGSTALQAYLALNKSMLENFGVRYGFQAESDETMGNGEPFYRQLYRKKLDENKLESLLNFYLGEHPVGLCSTEDFTRFGKSEWFQIRDVCKRIGVSVKIIVFIRNIAPYYRSLHGQLLKGGECSCSLSEFCSIDQFYPILDSLRCLIDIFGSASISVAHYESSIHQLDVAFMSILGLEIDSFDNKPLLQNLNRSLTQYEQAVLSTVNKLTGQQYSYELSNLLISNRPQLKTEKGIEADIVTELEARHSKDLLWINSNFFEGKNVVKVQDKTSTNNNGCTLDLEDKQGIDQDVANWALSKLQMAQDAGIDYVIACLRAIDWENAGNSAIPNDFDPIAYLLLNPDLLRAAAQPYEHFIVSGQHEHGRKWKWSTL